MHMLNPHCGVDRDPRGVVRLTICNAGSLNILGSAVINDVREGLEALATERQIRVLVLAGQSEKSMIGGADIKEMARLDQASAEKFITGLRDLCEAVRAFPAPVIARMPGWCLGGGLEVAACCDFRIAAGDARFGMPEVRVGIPSRDPCGAAAAADRLGPRPLAGDDGGEYRRAHGIGLGTGRRGRRRWRPRRSGRAHGGGTFGMRPGSAARAKSAAAAMGGTAAEAIGGSRRSACSGSRSSPANRSG